MTSAVPQPVIRVMQTWLALEHEAVWLQPVIGARFDALSDRARRSYASHLSTRDRLIVRLVAAGATPVATAISYALGPLTKPAQATAEALRLEESISATCLMLAGITSGRERTFATAELRRSALAALMWGAKPEAFPGLP